MCNCLYVCMPVCVRKCLFGSTLLCIDFNNGMSNVQLRMKWQTTELTIVEQKNHRFSDWITSPTPTYCIFTYISLFSLRYFLSFCQLIYGRLVVYSSIIVPGGGGWGWGVHPPCSPQMDNVFFFPFFLGGQNFVFHLWGVENTLDDGAKRDNKLRIRPRKQKLFLHHCFRPTFK